MNTLLLSIVGAISVLELSKISGQRYRKKENWFLNMELAALRRMLH